MHLSLSLSFSICYSFRLAVCQSYSKHPWQNREIAAPNVAKEYDFIIIGGGQSGLVVGNRLSEDPDTTVLVVEYGYFDNRPEQIDPASFGGLVNWPIQDLYNVTSTPQAGLLGNTVTVLAAAVVGGGSTVNGMMLTRGSADDYDNWAKVNEESDWGFQGLLPYFKKSATFREPAPELAHEYNITWDQDAYGSDSPIHESIASYLYPGLIPQWQGMEEAGLTAQVEGANGNAYGVFWYPNAIDNETVTRSYAVSGYYTPVADRANLHLLTGHRVNEILFDSQLNADGINFQPRGVPEGEDVVSVKARKEIILAAGALHSPQILQRSGVGPSSMLAEAGIEVLVDLPGVGSNLQDHPVSYVAFDYARDLDPSPQYMWDNSTFIEWAEEVWAENRTGPFAVTTGNTISLIPLSQLIPDSWTSVVETLQDQNSTEFLPVTYTTDQLAGFEAQRRLFIDSIQRNDNAVIEVPFNGSSSFATVLTKGMSRGTVHLDTTDRYAEPVIDYATYQNPVDARLMVGSIEFARRFHETAAMVDTFGPIVGTYPPANMTDYDQLEQIARLTTSGTIGHISGTCAMTPRRLGGVVGTDLLVHGVTGLSIADASIQPMIPSAHICTTVYAVAEKAADLIKSRHGLFRH
ncbi:hypothetical protein PFICI_03666 [Pestalotiopsis fici W106-1]|uniref:Glucose-methanol-choline oxidoreductase N-terminal domain-containing protein n=1 Tax=Pestalotiopsis fici (strain W106-1 / CGMCC3.15140) TaxID=1229662 RepID=W3XK78_PESFW|nr:uncharacterized protein PFICI_03666 [Pestalotiopsis fici W106-1]ETS85641.1 hypothetical protein PFICI_03666 [Pestalotiopsis fici W106-1]